jgi:hypothetical protein
MLSGLTALWICVSCATEYVGPKNPSQQEDKGILRLPMTRGSVQEESDIVRARMIVFKTNGAFVVNDSIPEYVGNPGEPYLAPTFVDTIPAGYVNVYLIANELPQWNLSGVTSEAQLRQIIYNYYTNPAYATQLPEADGTHHVPMFGMHMGLYVGVMDNDELAVPNPPVGPYDATVERIFAKVTLMLQCDFALQPSGAATPIELKSITLMQVPKESYLISRPYLWTNPASDFVSYTSPAFYPAPATPPTGWPVNTLTPVGVSPQTGFRDSLTFYVPEHLPSDTSMYTYLSIRLNVAGMPALEQEYRLALGEGLQVNPPWGNKFLLGDTIFAAGPERNTAHLTIQRNTHYVINAWITKFSLTGDKDMQVQLNVENWNEKNIHWVDFGSYELKVSQSYFNVGSLPFRAAVWVDADDPDGWSAVVKTGTVTLFGTGVGGIYEYEPSGRLEFEAYTYGEIEVSVGNGKLKKIIYISP